jgi:site-specific recombinase XerD
MYFSALSGTGGAYDYKINKKTVEFLCYLFCFNLREVPVEKEIKSYLDYFKDIKKIKRNTITSYTKKLNSFNEFITENYGILSVKDLRKVHLQEFINQLPDNYSNSTINCHIYALRSFFKYLLEFDFVEGDVSSTLEGKKIIIKEPEIIEKKEFLKITEFKIETMLDKRDIAILFVLYETGLYARELYELKIKDVIFEKSKLIIENPIREMDLSEKCLNFIKDFINSRNDVSNNDYLFVSTNNRKLESRTFYHILNTRISKAKIKKNISTLTFRTTFTNNLLNRGTDIREVKKLLGNSHTYLVERAIYREK